jgi:peptidyl-prolyl cis-trans isomerase A (cyclophilin A)
MKRIMTAIVLLAFAACGEEPLPPKPKKAPEPPPLAKKTPPPPPPSDPPKPVTPPKPPAADVPKILLDPTLPEWSKTAPAEYKAKFSTTKGDFTVLITREWAPQGADRFYNLVRNGFYDGVCFFRVVSNFMAQFGINGSPEASAQWRNAKIQDDPVTQSNTRGMITFATSGKNSRTTQVFISYRDNSNLDSMGFAPFGKVIEGMEVVDALYNGYGDGPPRGQGPNQARIQSEGNEYLKADFTKLDYVKTARIVEK